MTVHQAIAAAPIARRDAETLLLHVLARDRAWQLAHPEHPLPPEQQAGFLALTARRAAHEPLQYITGVQEFYGLTLRVTPDTLIPRPETELLVEHVLGWAMQFHEGRTLRIADVGTGSGAIAIALATHLAGASFFASDISPAALAVARGNAGAHTCLHRITFAERDLLSGIPAGSLDAVVSNPPYVPLADATTLQPEVRDHEPATALFGGHDGLSIYCHLIPQARTALKPGGLLAMEFGFGQRDALAALLEGWEGVRFVDDYAAIPRHVFAIRP